MNTLRLTPPGSRHPSVMRSEFMIDNIKQYTLYFLKILKLLTIEIIKDGLQSKMYQLGIIGIFEY